MNIYNIKLTLQTLSNSEINILTDYFNITSNTKNDILWLLSIKLSETKSANMYPDINIKELSDSTFKYYIEKDDIETIKKLLKAGLCHFEFEILNNKCELVFSTLNYSKMIPEYNIENSCKWLAFNNKLASF